MKQLGHGKDVLWRNAAAMLAGWIFAASAGPAGAAETSSMALLASTNGTVEISQAGATRWIPASTNLSLGAGDRLRTGERSRAVLLWADRTVATIGETTTIEILPAPEPGAQSGLHLWRGLLSLFHRDEPERFRVQGRSAMAATEGTEFVVAVDAATDAMTVSVIDGRVTLANAQGSLTLTNLEQAVAGFAQPPRRTAGFTVNNVLQWCFYYPGVLDAAELPFNSAEREALAVSLAAYRDGDLLAALANYPAERQPTSAAVRVYYAALLLSVGLAEQTGNALATLNLTAADVRLARLDNALRLLIHAVKRETRADVDAASATAETASEALALSYYEQSRATGDSSLRRALAAARRATELSPDFGFAWARVAELEFSFGRTAEARKAVGQSLTLSPRNAQALALQGFLLAAENKTRAAIKLFDQALAIDPALGNAWLGRGLCKIRLTPGFFSLSPRDTSGERAGVRGNVELSALDDLLIAAAVEPQRSLLRSYLGKAWVLDHRNPALARKELELAMHLDLADPTPWLYRALLNEQENRLNEAIRDLEKSQELNNNRRVYRSQLLLDQDRAVASANVAAIYRDAGMADLSVREAADAVAANYESYSAHLTLANSYNLLRDPNLINVRYESATFSEYLLGNLLASVGDSRLSPFVSQQEYSTFFDQEERLGFSSQTTYLSRGDWQQQASQYGRFNNIGYALDLYYRSQNGERSNNQLEQRTVSLQLKNQLGEQDSIYFQAIVSDFASGDVRQLYDPRSASPALRITEEQVPNLFGGYHHRWSPSIHTLFLAARLEDRFLLSDADVLIRGVARDNTGVITNTLQGIARSLSIDPAASDTFDALRFRSRFEAYSIELQQIARWSSHTLIFGGRYQDGQTKTQTIQRRRRGSFLLPTIVLPNGSLSTNFVAGQNNETDLTRASLYLYDQWQIAYPLWLTAGLTFDWLRYPRNIDSPPIADAERTKKQISPKAGFIWAPAEATTLAGAYTRSLGGLFYDGSVRLEPVQIAGFNQTYRSLIPPSEGALSGAQFETFDLGFKQEFGHGTYGWVQAQWLQSKGSRGGGVFDYAPLAEDYSSSSQIQERLKYEEQSLVVSLSQLVGREWTFGVRYKLSQADLKTRHPEVSDALIPDTHHRAVLHGLNLYAIFNHPSGFFAEAQSLWHGQSNYHYRPARRGDDFWQHNLFGGYRFGRQQAEITLGLLNLANEDYRLNPLSSYRELPRERTLLVSLTLNF